MESTTTSESASTPPSSQQDDNNSDSSTFECNICLETASQPVITMCGHLFCWPCIYRWMQLHLDSPQCPVCKSGISTEKLIPLYGRGKDQTDPRTKVPDIPNRPQGQHAEPHHSHQPQFGFFPGSPPLASAQFGNISFSAGIGFFPSLFGLQFQAYPNNPPYSSHNGPEQEPPAVLSRFLFMLAMLVLFFLLFF
jgi:E3 ubiquitin-protein ligase RNF5